MVGIREKINEKPGVALTLGAVIIVLVIVWIVWQQNGGSSLMGRSAKAWYTTDAGETWYLDDATNIPPYDYKGKQAVQCFIFTCGNTAKPFCGYLQRYTEQGKAARQDLQAKHLPLDNGQTPAVTEVKPGPHVASNIHDWIKLSDPKSNTLLSPACPDGSTQQAVFVDPNTP